MTMPMECPRDPRTMTLEEQHAQQEETITRYQRENDRLTKRAEFWENKDTHAQAYITKLKARCKELEAQLTKEAKADWVFEVTK